MKVGPGLMPCSIRIPSMIAVGASPGTPRDRTGAYAPGTLAMLQVSEPISPSMLPWPNSSGSRLVSGRDRTHPAGDAGADPRATPMIYPRTEVRRESQRYFHHKRAAPISDVFFSSKPLTLMSVKPSNTS